MLSEIKKEMKYWFWFCVIIAWGLIFCDIYDRYQTRESTYQNWTYNLDPSPGSAWIDAAVDRKKNP